MATKFILDTHALIWHLEGNPLLGPNARSVINSAASQLILPSIALAEAMYVVEKGRTTIPSVNHLMHDVGNDKRIEVFPLTLGVLEESSVLTAVPEIHDRLIVATGVYLQNLGESIEILTKDNEIIVSSILTVCW